MPSQSNIRAGGAFVELLVNDSKLAKGLDDAGKKLRKFGDGIGDIGKKVAGVGALVAAPMLAFAKVFSGGAHEIEKMSARTGIGVESLSALGYAAEMSGVEMESLAGGINRMQRTIVEAASGSYEAQESLAELGLTVKDLDHLSPDKQFAVIADKLAAIQNPTIRAAMAMKIFGRGAGELLPLLSMGSKGIEQWMEQARQMGLTTDRNAVESGVRLDQVLKTLWMQMEKVGKTIGSALAPMLTSLGKKAELIAASTIAWIKANKQVVITVFEVAAGVVAAGAAIMVLGYAISALGTVFSALGAVVGVVVTAFSMAAGVIGAILTPVGLVVTAVVALGAYVAVASGAAGKALQWLGDRFTDLKDFVGEAWEGIADALACGDIALAAKIMWLTVKLVWQKGVAGVEDVWHEFQGWLVKVAVGAFEGFLAAVEIVWHGVKVAWIEGTAFIRRTWSTLMEWHQKAVEGLAEAMVSAWLWAQEKTGAITPEDRQFQQQYADEDFGRQSKESEDQRKKQRAEADADLKKSRDEESKRHTDRMAGIGQDYEDIAAAVDKNNADARAKAQADLDKARQEWKDAIAAAKAKKGKGMGDKEPPKAPPGPGDLDESLDIMRRKVGVMGTFNAAAVRGFASGSNDHVARAANAAEKVAKGVGDIATAVKAGMNFGA